MKNSFAKQAGYKDLQVLKKRQSSGTQPDFRHDLSGGTHDIWLRYWAAACGLDATKTSRISHFKVIPPPQMVANMKVNNCDAFCVGEPWNGVAVKADTSASRTLLRQTSGKIIRKKPWSATRKFATERRDDLRKVMMAYWKPASGWTT
jgi:nitrate/nitrite transport system substrate-binding protein